MEPDFYSSLRQEWVESRLDVLPRRSTAVLSIGSGVTALVVCLLGTVLGAGAAYWFAPAAGAAVLAVVGGIRLNAMRQGVLVEVGTIAADYEFGPSQGDPATREYLISLHRRFVQRGEVAVAGRLGDTLRMAEPGPLRSPAPVTPRSSDL